MNVKKVPFTYEMMNTKKVQWDSRKMNARNVSLIAKVMNVKIILCDSREKATTHVFLVTLVTSLVKFNQLIDCKNMKFKCVTVCQMFVFCLSSCAKRCVWLQTFLR